ncbi:MAG TPA: right-handed parallel beta-helix repeat-containing protein [Thermoanaerobaculia bacterium]
MNAAFALIALIVSLTCFPVAVAHAQTPPVPSGFQLVDLVSPHGFELGFEPVSPSDGSVAHTTVNPIAGTGSLKITVNSYGRVAGWYPYGYGSGPFARSVTFVAKLRVDSATPAGRELTACSIAYFFDSPDPSQLCQNFPVDANNIVNVYLALDTQDRQLQYVFPQFALNDGGTIEATVDDVHFYVVQPGAPSSCTADTFDCGDWSACDNGTQTRTCSMTFDCPSVVTPPPATTQACDPGPGCTADTWSCSEWSACAADGTQTRTCTLNFDCPTASNTEPLTRTCTPTPPGGGPIHPASQGGRHVKMMSPTNGESFWASSSSAPAALRLVAQGFDASVSTNDPGPGHGQNASKVEFFVDGDSVLTVSGANAEYSVFKGYLADVALTPGTHIVWARATYVNPALVLDTVPVTITVQEPPVYAQTVNLPGDIVLSAGNPSYTLEGTPAARVRLNGNGFSISGTGNLTLRNVDVYDLGSRTNGLAAAIDVASTGAVVIENATFDSSNQVSLQLNGTATASIRGNTFRSNSRIPIGQQPYEPDTAYIVEISGNSTGAKIFSGNNVAAGAVNLTNASHWMLGGTTSADSNVMIGVRAAFELQNASNVTVQGNFVRNIYYGGWSQGQLMELGGSSPIKVLHNVLIGSSWPIRGIAGELAYNLVTNGGHTSLVPGNNASVHHNIFLGCGGGDGGDCNWGIIGGLYDVQNVQVVNNTFDALNQGSIVAAVFQQDGEAVVRSNTFARIPLLQNVPNAAVIDLTANGTLDTDYNAFYGPRTVRYGDGRTPAHDVVGTNPNFTGPLPTTPMDMDQVAVWKRQLSVSELLADYRNRYTPASNNPVIDAGDPAGGSGNDIGAIGAGSPNALDLFGTFGTNFVAVHPTAPQNLYAAGISPSRIYLKWSPSASPVIPGEPQRTITGYRIIRDGVHIATVNGALRYEDSGLSPDSSHSYSVVAVDSAAKLSAQATVTATTLPAMPVASSVSHPVLLPAGYLASLAAGGPAWTALKADCDASLNTLIRDSWAGWDWHDAAVDYSTCYQVAKLQNDTVNAAKYEKKALALAVVLARHHNLGTPDDGHPDNVLQPIGLGDGATTTFTLPFTPMDPAQVRVVLVGTTELTRTRAATGNDVLGDFAPILKISNTAGGAASYAPSDYELRFRDGSEIHRLAWTGPNQPAANATYYVTMANGAATNVASSAITIDAQNLTLTFATAPAANQAVTVAYLGTNYEQTGNGLGGVNSVQPDGPGYQMRTFNPGLATAYDALRDSPLLTTALKSEFTGVLNRQVEWCAAYCFENNGTGGNVGNYFIRGLLAGTFATAYATEGENPQAAQFKADANTRLVQMIEGVAKILPGGYGAQGQYANGTTEDILEFLSLYQDVTGLDLAPRLDWTHNVVAATVHGTKPNLTMFYDGGDWSNLPAYPLSAAMEGFVTYQPAHATAPFARKLLEELGETPSGTVTDYRTTFPLSYFGQGSPFYARSDWSANAIWMSLAANDTGAVAHQHKDAGHFTIQRGADYLLKTAGGYDKIETLYHNTYLIDDRNITGYNPVSVYPPDQGWWGRESQLTKHADAGAYTYSQADFADSYLNNDGVRNSVKRALRSIVYFRPGTFVVFDQMQVAHPAIRKTFNVNFGGTLTNQGGIWTAALGQSKLFMQPLLNSVTPVTAPLSGANISPSINFQETLSGNLKDVFLHVFQATDASTSTMTAGNAMRSVDRNVQGVEIAASGTTWAVLFAAYDRAFAGAVQYLLPSGGAHSHLLHDLLPSNAYVVSVTNANGGVQRTINATSDANGTLTFDTANGESYFYVTPGSNPPAVIPPVTTDPNA